MQIYGGRKDYFMQVIMKLNTHAWVLTLDFFLAHPFNLFRDLSQYFHFGKLILKSDFMPNTIADSAISVTFKIFQMFIRFFFF